MMDTVYGMNQTVINDVFPTLVPAINAANKLHAPAIDVFTALGGVKDWATTYPKKGCTVKDTAIAKCPFFCDAQSCDQCHPDNNGCALPVACPSILPPSPAPLSSCQSLSLGLSLCICVPLCICPACSQWFAVFLCLTDRPMVAVHLDTAMAAAMKKGIGL